MAYVEVIAICEIFYSDFFFFRTILLDREILTSKIIANNRTRFKREEKCDRTNSTFVS